MAYKANDGSQFTNRPSMHAHNARLDQAKQGKGPHKPVPTPGGGNPHGEPADSESHHEVSHMVKCPHCGGDIDADEIAANRDSSTAAGRVVGTGAESGSTEV